jgi:hypothetical protein
MNEPLNPFGPPDSAAAVGGATAVKLDERPWGGDSLVWAAAFAGWLLFYGATAWLLDLLSLLVIFAMVFTGLTGLLVAGVALRRKRTRRPVYAVMIILALWCAWIYLPVRDIGLWVRLSAESAVFEAAIVQLREGREPECLADKRCEIDRGPPARVAFNWGGFEGLWAGVVVDPTGTLMETERNRELFGAKQADCRRLKEHLYLCSFS